MLTGALPFIFLFYSLIGFSYGSLSIGGFRALASWSWILAAIIGLLLLFKNRERSISSQSLSVAACFSIVFIFLSDFLGRKFIFYNGSSYIVELLVLGIISSFILFRAGKSNTSAPFWIFLLIVQSFLIAVFINTTGGKILFSDDHPSFYYRLVLLKKHFPYIPFYNLDWNAGYSAREFFPSGVLNVFFLVVPFIYSFDKFATIEGARFYTYLIPYVYFFILPWAVYHAARAFSASVVAATIAGILAIGPSTAYFEWLLKYGTLGFSLSSGINPLTVALSMRLAISEQKPSWSLVLCLLIVSFFSLSWSLSVTSLLPVIAISLIFFKKLIQKGRFEKILIFALLFVICNGPWILTFIQESKVTSFVGGNALPGGGQQSHLPTVRELLNEFRSYLQKINPVILLFSLPGLLLIKDKMSKIVLSATIFWLLFVSATGEYIKPQLELRRMVVPAAFFMCVPAGVFISNIIQLFKSNVLIKPISSFAIAVVIFGVSLVSPFNVANVLANRSDERFKFAEDDVVNFIEKVKEADSGNGRIFFLGFILQEFGASHYGSQDGGHIASLPVFTDKTFYASDYYHRHWSEVDPIPKEYRDKHAEGIEPFLDTLNASSVVTFTKVWADYCKSLPQQYTQLFQVGRFRLFRRNSENISDFLNGSGEIKRAKEGFYIKMNSKRVVLKYRYLPKLKASNGVEIKPFFVFNQPAGKNKTKQFHYIELIADEGVVSSSKWVKVGYYL